MSPALSPGVGEGNRPNHEFEPATYLESVRRFLHENGAGGMNLQVTDELQEQLREEEAASRLWVMAVCADEYASSMSTEEMEWIGDGFPTIMTRLLKVSTKLSKDGPDTPLFTAMNPENQERLRRHIFDEYLELSGIFIPEGGSPVRGTYRMSPVLYYGPGEVQSLVAENEDLGHHNTLRAIRHHPLNTQEFLDRARDTIEATVEKFPAIPRIVIQSHILRLPNNYEKHLLKYAEKHGISLEAREPVALDTSSFLGTLRDLVRSRKYQLNRQNPSAEAIEAAESLGQEVLDFLEESGPSLDERSINAFQARVKQLTLVANRAWRQGDLDVALERSPEDFRREVFGRLLADFTIMSAQLNSPSKAAHLALLYDSGEVQAAAAANSDLPPYVIADLLLRSGRIQDNVEIFREQLAELQRAYPRLTESDAIQAIISNTSIPAGAEAPTGAAEYTPRQFLEDVRAYAQTHLNAVNSVTERSRAEFERRLPEMLDYFESAGWTFGGTELPEKAQAALIKKAGEFITVSLRAFRDGGVDATLDGFTAEERGALYGEFAENYTRIIKVLGIGSATAWKRAPALYIDAGELESLRSQYDWLRDGVFCNAVIKNPNSVKVTLEKVAETRALLQLTYPGLSDYHLNRIAVTSPVTAAANAIAQVRTTSEWEFGRGSDLLKEPDGKNTLKLYKHLRTLAKHDRMPNLAYFEPETEERIADFRGIAARVIAEQPGTDSIDDEQIDKMLSQVEHYVRASEALHREDSYPSVLELDDKARRYFVKYLYSNQAKLNELTAQQMNGNWKFRTYSFGFFHEAGYLEKLWKQFEPYMPLRHVTLIALTAPRRPIDSLSDMVEYRAQLLRDDPELSADAVNAAMWDRARGKR